MTAFFNSIYSIHIGKQHWEKDGKNAYALNDVSQGVKKIDDNEEPAKAQAQAQVVQQPQKLKEPEWQIVRNLYKEAVFPHAGSMREHLDWFLERIRGGKPFAIIRPSDGERMIMLGKTLTNCDRWTFQEGGSLQKLLLDSVKILNVENIAGGIDGVTDANVI